MPATMLDIAGMPSSARLIPLIVASALFMENMDGTVIAQKKHCTMTVCAPLNA